MLMLHGCTQNPEDFALGTRMNALAEEFGLIVAYPHQPRLANPNGCWNWFDRRHQNRGSGEPAKLAGLAQALAKEFDVRRERVFAAGPVGGRRDGGDSRRDLPRCVRRGRDPFRPALQVSRRRPLRLRRDEGNGGLSPRAAPSQAIGMPARSLFMGWPTGRSSRQRRTPPRRGRARKHRSREAISTGRSRAAASAARR